MPSPKDVSPQIKEANKALCAGVAQGDAAACAAMYTKKAQLLTTGAPVIRGKKAITQWWQAGIDSGIKKATLTSREVETHGTTAIEVGVYKLVGADRQVLDNGKYIVIWKKEDRQWKLHRDIFNTNVAPAE